MAMAYPVPGYGKRRILRGNERIASAPPDIQQLREMLRPMAPNQINGIRKSAKASWQDEVLRIKQSKTSYNGMHWRKELDEPTQTRVRPSSPTRQNKPHPPEVFLVNRLRKVKGCFEPDTYEPGESPDAKERLNQYVQANREKIDRAMGKSPRVESRTEESRDRERMQRMIGEVPAQAAEAWIKLSNDKDKEQIRKSFKRAEADVRHKLEASEFKESARQQQAISKRNQKHPISLRPGVGGRPGDDIYSTTRWLKRAGQQENAGVRGLLDAFRLAPPRTLPKQGPHFHITDYSPMFAPAPRQPFYDFQIHPEWNQPWHKKYDDSYAVKVKAA